MKSIKRGNRASWRGARGLPAGRTAALPPGDYIVEVDDNKLPFPTTEGEVFEVKPQQRADDMMHLTRSSTSTGNRIEARRGFAVSAIAVAASVAALAIGGVRAVAADPGIAARLAPLGQVVNATTPSEYAAAIEDQRAKVAAIAQALGIKPAR